MFKAVVIVEQAKHFHILFAKREVKFSKSLLTNEIFFSHFKSLVECSIYVPSDCKYDSANAKPVYNELKKRHYL